jgi:hypothetical protein
VSVANVTGREKIIVVVVSVVLVLALVFGTMYMDGSIAVIEIATGKIVWQRSP